jgi:hypothetical protein
VNSTCREGHHCPQVLLQKDGNFTVVGLDIREEALKSLPPGPGIGPKEGAVMIPRDVMFDVMADILSVAKVA